MLSSKALDRSVCTSVSLYNPLKTCQLVFNLTWGVDPPGTSVTRIDRCLIGVEPLPAL